MIDISELHDKFEKISDVTKVLIVGKKMDAIGKMERLYTQCHGMRKKGECSFKKI